MAFYYRYILNIYSDRQLKNAITLITQTLYITLFIVVIV